MVIKFEIILFNSTLLLEQKNKMSISFKFFIILLLFILYLLYIISFKRSLNYVHTSPRLIIIGYSITPDSSNTTS